MFSSFLISFLIILRYVCVVDVVKIHIAFSLSVEAFAVLLLFQVCRFYDSLEFQRKGFIIMVVWLYRELCNSLSTDRLKRTESFTHFINFLCKILCPYLTSLGSLAIRNFGSSRDVQYLTVHDQVTMKKWQCIQHLFFHSWCTFKISCLSFKPI